MLARYEARKAWRDVEGIEDSVEDGWGDRESFLILLYTIDKTISWGSKVSELGNL